MKTSTLVLIDEAEFDLEVSTSHVTFTGWARSGAGVRLSSEWIVCASQPVLWLTVLLL